MKSLFGKIVLGCAGLALLMLAAYALSWQVINTQELKKKLSDTEDTLERLSIDHRDTMDALNKAQKSREEIYEKARQQEKRLHEVLAKNPLAGQLIPDDWRMCLQWGEDGDCEVSAPRNAAGGHSDTRPLKTQDGGRHGADNR